MKISILLLLLLNKTVFGIKNGTSRIAGGVECDVKDYPFMVTMVTLEFRRKSWCGGSLVTPSWVLTAGHCIRTKRIFSKNTFVRSGFNLERKYVQTRRVVVGVRHPNFPDPDIVIKDLRYDIGLMLVITPFHRTSHLDVIKLPPVGFAAGCVIGKALGCGDREVTDERYPIGRPLDCIDLTIVNISVCRLSWSQYIDDSVICTMEKAEKSVCKGDSGGPLMCGGFVIGVIIGNYGCGLPGNASVYTRVDEYLDFIKKTIARMEYYGASTRIAFDLWLSIIILIAVICRYFG